jgi:hypothetical protein
MARRGRNTDPTAPDAGDLGEPLDPVALAGGDAGGGDGGDGGPGDGGGSDFVFDPERHIAPDKRNADGSYRRKRARKGGRKAASGSPLSVSGIEAILLSIHAVAASSLNAPEIALDKTEANQLAAAVAEVARHYPTSIDPKVMAWINLAMVGGMVYGPRWWVIRARVSSGKKAPKKAEPANGPVDVDAATVAAQLRQVQ